MLDPITTDAVMRMFLDGLSVDEVLVALPTLERSDLERILFADRANKRQQERNADTLEKIDNMIGNAAWRIK